MTFSYNKATLYGQSYVDYLWIKNKVDTQTEIDSTLGNTYKPTWNDDTLLLANFDDTLGGGNIPSLTDNILYWQIYRKKPEDTALTFICKVPASQYKLVDFNVLNNTEYQYTIFAETETTISAPFEQVGYINTHWWNWSLVGLQESETTGLYYADSENIWLFDTELSSSSLDQNISKYVMDNFTRYPSVSSGLKNYITGSITAFLSNVDIKAGKYEDTVAQYNAFVEFIVQPTPKLLRDRKGNGWIVSTTDANAQYIDESPQQIIRVSFGFTQLNDVRNVNIIGG